MSAWRKWFWGGACALVGVGANPSAAEACSPDLALCLDCGVRLTQWLEGASVPENFRILVELGCSQERGVLPPLVRTQAGQVLASDWKLVLQDFSEERYWVRTGPVLPAGESLELVQSGPLRCQYYEDVRGPVPCRRSECCVAESNASVDETVLARFQVNERRSERSTTRVDCTLVDEQRASYQVTLLRDDNWQEASYVEVRLEGAPDVAFVAEVCDEGTGTRTMKRVIVPGAFTYALPAPSFTVRLDEPVGFRIVVGSDWGVPEVIEAQLSAADCVPVDASVPDGGVLLPAVQCKGSAVRAEGEYKDLTPYSPVHSLNFTEECDDANRVNQSQCYEFDASAEGSEAPAYDPLDASASREPLDATLPSLGAPDGAVSAGSNDASVNERDSSRSRAHGSGCLCALGRSDGRGAQLGPWLLLGLWLWRRRQNR